MKTIKLLGAALSIAAVVPTIAHAEFTPKERFTYEGVTYTYSTTKTGDATIYKGRDSNGTHFVLVARNGQVSGRVNDMQVAFETPSVEILADRGMPQTLASR